MLGCPATEFTGLILQGTNFPCGSPLFCSPLETKLSKDFFKKDKLYFLTLWMQGESTADKIGQRIGI